MQLCNFFFFFPDWKNELWFPPIPLKPDQCFVLVEFSLVTQFSCLVTCCGQREALEASFMFWHFHSCYLRTLATFSGLLKSQGQKWHYFWGHCWYNLSWLRNYLTRKKNVRVVSIFVNWNRVQIQLKSTETIQLDNAHRSSDETNEDGLNSTST